MANKTIKEKFLNELSFVIAQGSNPTLESKIVEAFNKATTEKSKLTTKRIKRGLLQHTIKCNCQRCIDNPQMSKSIMLDEFRKGEFALEYQDYHGKINRMFIGMQELKELRNSIDEIINIKVN